MNKVQCFFFLMIRRPPRSTPFPYTPLFQSSASIRRSEPVGACRARTARRLDGVRAQAQPTRSTVLPRPCPDSTASRSEEHTSELQSLQYLVCRLLLEKKKKKYKCHTSIF